MIPGGSSVADRILAALSLRGTSCAFLIPGYLTGPYNAALAAGRLKPVVCTHELGAGYMADGYARVSGRIGCAIGISGPGVLNMITAAASVASDCVPVLFLAGDVGTANAGRGAFQDGGDCGTRDRHLFGELLSCARHSSNVDAVGEDLLAALSALERIPPEPAFLSFPRDVLAASCPPLDITPESRAPGPDHDNDGWKLALGRLLGGAGRIALLVGEDAKDEQLAPLLRAAVERHCLPVATTVTAKGILAEDHPLCVGCFGYGAAPRARAAFLDGELDALLVIGADFTQRNTLDWHAEIVRERPGCRLVRRSGARPFATLPDIVADYADVFRWLASSDDTTVLGLAAGAPARRDWIARLHGVPMKQHWAPTADGLHPAEIVEVMRAVLPEETVLFVDAGLGRRVVGQYWRCLSPGRIFASPITGPMGWGLAASLGGKLASPETPVVALAGDGSMLMHGMELATAVRYSIPVIWVINDNQALGTIRLRADSPMEADLTVGMPIRWAELAHLLGASAHVAETANELAAVLRLALQADGPTVIHVKGSLAFAADDTFFGQ